MVFVFLIIPYKELSLNISITDSCQEMLGSEAGAVLGQSRRRFTRCTCSFNDVMRVLRIAFVSLINGLANVFIVNFVHIVLIKDKTIGMKKRKTFYRQLLVDSIFFIENAILFGVGVSSNAEPLNDQKIKLNFFAVVFSCYILGIVLKVFYYRKLHIWKNLTPKYSIKNKRFVRATAPAGATAIEDGVELNCYEEPGGLHVILDDDKDTNRSCESLDTVAL